MEFPQEIRNLDFYGNNFLEYLQLMLNNYNRRFFERINFQSAILPQINEAFVQSMGPKRDSELLKFDISSAFLNALSHNNFYLPKNEILAHFVGPQADIIFQSLDFESSEYFGICKCVVRQNQTIGLPITFFPNKCKDGSQFYKIQEFCPNAQSNCVHNCIEVLGKLSNKLQIQGVS